LGLDLLICDEATMMDLWIMNALLKALQAGCRVVLVGDVYQLPSVGPGQVFADLIKSERFPVVRLENIYRQRKGSTIALAAQAIREKHVPDWKALRNESNELSFVPHDDPETLIDTVVAQTLSLIREGYDLEDIQIIIPQKKGRCGVPVASFRLQQALGRIQWKNNNFAYRGEAVRLGTRIIPKDLEMPIPSRRDSYSSSELKALVPRDIWAGPGDKVRQTSNNYDLHVLNGDMGIVQQVDSMTNCLSVTYPHIDNPVIYESAFLNNLDLAFAITTHVSQGSQWKACIIVMSTAHWIMLQNNLFYTAISRAQERCIVVGSTKAISRAVHNVKTGHRVTLLANRIKAKD